MSVLSNFTRFSDLPEDIQRTIFEVASQNGDGTRCALVSRTVKSWVEPAIYHCILLQRKKVADLVYRTLLEQETTKPPEFFATHIKTIIIATGDVNDRTAAMLKKCRAVQNLVIWSSFERTVVREIFSSTEPFLTPTGVYVIRDLFPDGRYYFHYPSFVNITHLELVCREEDDWKEDNKFSQLKHLTHLSLDLRYDPSSVVQVVREALSQCVPELCILSIWSSIKNYSRTHPGFRDIKAIGEGEVDVRAVNGSLDVIPAIGSPVVYRRHFNILRDLAGTSPDPQNHFWTQAEVIVRSRRQRLEG